MPVKVGEIMNARVYLLLDIVNGDCAPVIERLSGRPGVTSVDWLEGNPNIIVSLEAPDRYMLAKLMMPLLESIENVTEDLRLLIGRVNEQSAMPVPS